MGEVYKATDTRLDRTVAVKVISEQIAGNIELRSRFEREARAVALLDHPHICAVYDVGQQDEVSYLVMQYLEGETLAARLARANGPLPLAQVLTIGSRSAVVRDGHRKAPHSTGIRPPPSSAPSSIAEVVDGMIPRVRSSRRVAVLGPTGASLGPSCLTEPGSGHGGA